jgi:hypothetical protein
VTKAGANDHRTYSSVGQQRRKRRCIGCNPQHHRIEPRGVFAQCVKPTGKRRQAGTGAQSRARGQSRRATRACRPGNDDDTSTRIFVGSGDVMPTRWRIAPERAFDHAEAYVGDD